MTMGFVSPQFFTLLIIMRILTFPEDGVCARKSLNTFDRNKLIGSNQVEPGFDDLTKTEERTEENDHSCRSFLVVYSSTLFEMFEKGSTETVCTSKWLCSFYSSMEEEMGSGPRLIVTKLYQIILRKLKFSESATKILRQTKEAMENGFSRENCERLYSKCDYNFFPSTEKVFINENVCRNKGKYIRRSDDGLLEKKKSVSALIANTFILILDTLFG